MSRIFWLASYPKSGNTWLRIFLVNLRLNSNQPASINSLGGIPHAADRSFIDDLLGLKSSDLTAEETEYYRPLAYRYAASGSDEGLFLKIHDAYSTPPESPVPADVSGGAVYLVRNPLDLAVSLAHHLDCSIDCAIDCMALDTMALFSHPNRLHHQCTQYLQSWSSHVRSWLDQTAVPVHLMRYEDMNSHPVETFVSAIRFLGLGEDGDRLRKAIEFSSFSVLRSQEQAEGFREKPPNMKAFFRDGRTGTWRDVLTKDQVNRIVTAHGTVMERLGYPW